MRAFKQVYGSVEPRLTRVSLHMDVSTHQRDNARSPTSISSEDAHGFHMFREQGQATTAGGSLAWSGSPQPPGSKPDAGSLILVRARPLQVRHVGASSVQLAATALCANDGNRAALLAKQCYEVRVSW